LQHSDAVQHGDFDLAVRQLTETASQMLRVDRVSVWRFDSERTSIDCVDLFSNAGGHTSGMTLARASFPAYFDALAEARTIAANDAHVDPRTCEFSASYLTPLGIGAMLDAPIFLGDEMFGVVCHEHVGDTRHWHFWEELVAATIADFVSLVYLTRQRREHEARLQRHRVELEQTVAERTRQLRESEESFRRLFEACPIPLVLSATADNALIGINRRASEVFGIPIDAAKGAAPADFYTNPEDRAAILMLLAKDGHAYDFKTRLRTRHGRELPVLMSAQTVVLEGRPAVLAGIQDVTQQEAIEARLRDLATRDPLLQIYNRRHFFDLAAHEAERAKRYARPLSVAMIDVDHFKQVNDRHGHAVGDQVLAAIAAACAASVRTNDVLARYGGEELVVLLPETDIGGAEPVVERLRAAIEGSVIPTDAGPVRATVSAGVVERRQGESLESMLVRADRALYRAKQSGRNRVIADEASRVLATPDAR
jgi:diguanylate cyclase (GGDEF)-like protein/PAS domain S-box-containing protein